MRTTRATAQIAAAPTMVSFTFNDKKAAGRRPVKKAVAKKVSAKGGGDLFSIVAAFSAPAPAKNGRSKAARGGVKAGFEKVPSAQPGSSAVGLVGQFFSEENWAVQAVTLLKDLPSSK